MGSRNISGHTAKLIDDEVKKITEECYQRAVTLLDESKDILEAMKDALMEYETIDSEQVDDLMARRKVRPPKSWEGGGGGDAGADAADKEKPSASVGKPASEH